MKKIKISLGIILFMLFFIIILPIKSYAIPVGFWTDYQMSNGRYAARGVWGIYKSIVLGGADWLNAACNYKNGDGAPEILEIGSYIGEANISWAEKQSLTQGKSLIDSRYAFCAGHRKDGAGGYGILCEGASGPVPPVPCKVSGAAGG